jgi:NAD(P)-dependent dehydrogenase (short-subunit alcohol dehydrogenase family)
VSKKIAIITGSNTGIGYEAAKRLVQQYGWEVILACRSKDKALAAQQEINNYYNKNDENDNGSSSSNNRKEGKAVVLDSVLDLSDFESIRRFAKEVREKYDRVDILINNAGRNTSGQSGKLDLMFQSNYLGHFLLTNLFLEDLQKSSDGGKVINVSSVMHHFCGSESKASVGYWKERALYRPDPLPGVYSASKLAAILHSIELNRRYGKQGLFSLAVNPGSVNSDIWRGFPGWMRTIFAMVYLTSEQGSIPLIAAAVLDDWKEDGITYLQPYWVPTLSSTQRFEQQSLRPMMPYTEMLGPYVGYTPTNPRLPPDGGIEAAHVLWDVSQTLTLRQE